MIDLAQDELFISLDEWREDAELKNTVFACIQAQKEGAREACDREFRLDPLARHRVSRDALKAILTRGRDISDIRTDSDISNCFVFHAKGLRGTCLHGKVIATRKKADAVIAKRIRETLKQSDSLAIVCSGHFWYPPGGFMGWHTNLRKPGWRLYVNYAEQAGESFFRYYDPIGEKVVTAVDETWNFRLFHTSPARPLWHAVYSNTNRFSLGYLITERE